VGWKNGLDPNPNFSVDFYLKTNHDIKLYGINPFYHYLKSGKKEGRNPVGLFHISKKSVFRPKVTAIVPNYNHEKFLEVRINSILNQTYKEIDIILLDDCSSDNSIEVLKSFEDKYPDRIKFVPNENNSGNVFRQWKKGLGLVKSEFVWICESDDAANPTFVESLIPYFLDRAVMIAFGKIQFITQEGKYMPGLDGFREGAKQGIWEDVQIRSAAEWFNGPFGIRNIIPNVGGCIFRNQTISEDVWKEAESYKVLGDWYLYSRLANGGNIAYDPTAVAYFRQHGKNTSVGSFTTDRYYDEHYRFMVQLKKMWNIKEETVDKFIEYTKWQYKHHFGQDKEEDFYKIFDVEDVRSTKKVRTHLLIGFLGFHVGGGELFPIQLASEIVKDDNFIVSMIALNRNNEVQEVIDQLDKRVSVYSADILKRKEINKFLDSAGIEIVNTHNVGMEFQFLIGNEVALNIPYTVTLHGSYEVANLSDSIIIELLKKVNHWIYTADRNLTHFEGIPLSPTALTKLSNLRVSL
jgi:glycosyltransferase involved in cell wall biosynthesis